MQSLHLGDLLVRNGVLTSTQRDEVLQAQRTRGGPFGALAEEMFGVSAQAVESAWAEQYASFAPHVDPRKVEVNKLALDVLTRRQAWQFCILPLKLHGDDLVACTTQEHLVRALKFAGWRLGHATQFVISDPQHLGEALCKWYPMAGMTPDVVTKGLPFIAA
ncbi:MAG: hypothetical protein KF864_00460 [Phycisphaeraceae bacterium]|nr:hypothetical protein [Phycisphaeraceae bacterium]MBX3410583.1 hypothetical protein [Phycisphaeraceae bacterium]